MTTDEEIKDLKETVKKLDVRLAQVATDVANLPTTYASLGWVHDLETRVYKLEEKQKP